jgi:hypothetical protein
VRRPVSDLPQMAGFGPGQGRNDVATAGRLSGDQSKLA